MNLSHEIRQRREALAMSQGELAAAIGKSGAFISHLETGNRDPSMQTLISLATALHCSVGDFFGETTAPKMTICPLCAGRGCLLESTAEAFRATRREAMLQRIMVESSAKRRGSEITE